MNNKLIKSLAQIILSLSAEERILLDNELQSQENWQKTLDKIKKHRQNIYERKQNQSFTISVDEIFVQMREERDNDLLKSIYNNGENNE
jgi:hypothetical protein